MRLSFLGLPKFF